jgi:carboxymethylenebutenolidase
MHNTQVALVRETLSIPVEDGTTMDGYLVRPEAPGPHPGLLVIQEIFGVNSHIRDVTERWAAQGYVALAPDIFHRPHVAGPGYQGSYEDIPASVAVAMKTRPEELAADLKGAYARLCAHPAVRADRVGVLGFCMGGTLAYRANALLPLQAAVAYYGGGIGPELLEQAGNLHGPILFFWAGKDLYIPLENRRAVADALRRHGKPFVDVEFSNQNHGFFCDARSDHDADAAAQSFALATAFLRSHLG